MAGPFKMKGSQFYGRGNSSAVKHTRSRGSHMKMFGKGHTNEDHPEYWDAEKGKTEEFHDSKGRSNKAGDIITDYIDSTRKSKKKKSPSKFIWGKKKKSKDESGNVTISRKNLLTGATKTKTKYEGEHQVGGHMVEVKDKHGQMRKKVNVTKKSDSTGGKSKEVTKWDKEGNRIFNKLKQKAGTIKHSSGWVEKTPTRKWKWKIKKGKWTKIYDK